MSNLAIATPALSDAATITTSSETSSGPVTNLKKMQPTDLWDSGIINPSIDIDLGSVADFNLLALLHTNAAASSTWSVKTADTQANLTSSPAETVNGISFRKNLAHYDGSLTNIVQSPDVADEENHTVLWIPDGFSNRWVRIAIVDVLNPDGGPRIGRLVIADALQPTYNYDYGASDGFDDDSTVDVTDGGQLIPNDGTNRPVFEFTLNTANEAERHTVRELHRQAGASSDVLVLKNPQPTINPMDHIKHGLLQRRRVAVNTAFNRHQAQYILTGL